MRTSISRGLAAVAFAATSIAHAEVRLELFAAASSGTPVHSASYTFVDQSGTSHSNSISFLDSLASGSADLDTGALKAFARAANDSIGTATTATVVLGDRFTFNGGQGQTAYLDYEFEGNISLETNKPSSTASSGRMSIYLSNPGLGTSAVYDMALSNPGYCSVLTAANNSLGCYEGSSISRSGSIAIVVAPGEFYVLNTLSAVATAGDSVSFENTARFFLRLPDGVTIESRTGHFLTAALPIAAVPEPGSYAMMLLGLGAIGAWMRRRKEEQA